MTVVEEFKPQHRIRIDTLFWQHRSPFLGSQEQLNELAREADAKAAARAAARAQSELMDYLRSLSGPRPRPSVFDVHRPAVRRLRAIVHVGLIPMLWAITTCRCGERWPCHSVKRHLRAHLGWSVDITEELKALTRALPRPRTRFSRLRALLRRYTAG